MKCGCSYCAVSWRIRLEIAWLCVFLPGPGFVWEIMQPIESVVWQQSIISNEYMNYSFSIYSSYDKNFESLYMVLEVYVVAVLTARTLGISGYSSWCSRENIYAHWSSVQFLTSIEESRHSFRARPSLHYSKRRSVYFVKTNFDVVWYVFYLIAKSFQLQLFFLIWLGFWVIASRVLTFTDMYTNRPVSNPFHSISYLLTLFRTNSSFYFSS